MSARVASFRYTRARRVVLGGVLGPGDDRKILVARCVAPGMEGGQGSFKSGYLDGTQARRNGSPGQHHGEQESSLSQPVRLVRANL